MGEHVIECPQSLLQAAGGGTPVRTAVVNAINTLALSSARDATDAGLIEPVLVGNLGEIRAAADSIGWDIAIYEVIEANGEEAAAMASAASAGRGAVGALMKGHLHTDTFMKAVLNRDAGLRMGQPLAHIAHLTVPGKTGSIILSDGALNPAPDVEQKKAIVRYTVELARALGNARPKVALLSASEVVSPKVPSTVDAVEIAKWAKDAIADADVDGPLAFDLAVSPEAVEIKGIKGSAVAGQADILVVPDIVSGNALMKMMIRYMGACLGGVVVGAKVPIILTSRADAPAARLASAALAAALTRVS
ncbi:MAG: bifunctional enoyl-CoA hydratase/phosphate acetyltransferase [Alphaproteobacteria bacterium]|nr:bifunctional enoyl-CoA hydratase/phosphate acetyltransferase [Alphaproteobacteria bacterium]